MIRRRRRVPALVAAGALLASGLAAAPATPAQAQGSCEVDYETSWDSGSGFGADITITNLGDALSSWELGFTFPGDQQVTHGWSADWSQSGSDVTASNTSWNGNLGSGASISIGFNGSYSGSNEDPTSFTLNGAACNGGEPPAEPPEVSITSPADGAEFADPADITVEADASSPQGSIDEVEFYIDGNLAGTDGTAPYSYTHEGVPEGSYTLGARAVDDAGQTADDEVTVSVTAPSEPTIQTSLDEVNFTEGSTGSYDVSLSEAPSGTLTVTTEQTGGSSALTVQEGASLTFDASNYDEPQEVVVAAAEDSGGDSAEFTSSASGYVSATVTANSLASSGDGVWIDRFMEQYDTIKNSGYFSDHGIPYHSIETLIVEAPDYGHVTTSEAFSFWLWLEANYGRIQQDWEPFNQAWETMETYIVPDSDQQPSAGVDGDATYAPEHTQPDQYPAQLDDSVPVGEDPLRSELESTHGTGDIYGMHWLLDVDNAYGYGECGDGSTSPAYINTFQRGSQESVWETVPHPSCETFDFGGENGFVDLFTSEVSGNDPAEQWRYTNAPDADARAVQVAYWALDWAREQGNESEIAATVDKAAMMGDYLRYSLFDKYFKEIGNCTDPMDCPAGSGRDSAHYLLSWYYSWGGSYPGDDWSWRIGSSYNHFGYQNPMSAYAMSNEPELQTSSSTFTDDWENSLERTLEFYLWLQSPEGAIAGGATNSWNGAYETPPAGTPTFYGMFYDEHPVYHDPGSNEWFGMQVWSLQRLAEYLYETGDERAQQVLDNWVPWALSETTLDPDGDYQIPATMEWSGAPDTWDPNDPLGHTNPDLSVEVTDHSQDVGVTASYARTLMWYAAATGDTEAQQAAESLLEGLYANAGPDGIVVPEERGDYERFLDVHGEGDNPQDGIYIPEGWSGQMGNGETIEPGVTFYDLRESIYADDPNIDQVLAYAEDPENVDPPTFEYHRSWAQMDIANAFADYAHLFPGE